MINEFLLDRTLIDFIINDANLLVIIFNNNGRIIKTNNYFGELTGKSGCDYKINDVLIDFKNTITNEIYKRQDNPILINVSTKTGIPQTYYFRIYPIDNLFLAIGELSNIEIEELRLSLIQLNNDLSNLSRELHKKNAELEKLNDLKNQILGMAAHDLRNPIGVVLSYSDYLLEECKESLNDEQIKFIEIIRNSSEFMLKLLDDLLDLAKIEMGKLILNKEKCDIVKLAKQNIEINRIIAGKKQIDIFLNAYDDIPLIEIDKLKIEQVFNNLISNAIKYSNRNSKITVNIFKSENNIEVSVCDEGLGIPEEDLNNIFKPFYKANVKPTANEGSTGLGLVIVRKIILGHMGNIWIKSKVGKGTTVYFSLPF
jgi:signal transduction histidine kinase